MPRPQTRWGGCLGRFHDGRVEGCEAIPRDRGLEGLHHQAEPNESVVAMAPAMNAFRQAPAAPRWAASVAVLVPESSIDDRPRNSSQISTAIHNMSWLEWLTVPFTFLFINVFEWAVSCHRPFFEDFRERRARLF